jgi:hypothetical protein
MIANMGDLFEEAPYLPSTKIAALVKWTLLRH